MIIRRIDELSLGKITGLIHAIFGLFMGITLALISLFSDTILINQYVPGMVWFPVHGAAAIIVLPVMQGLFGFLAGVLVALVYNLVANRIGGLKIKASVR